MCLEGSHIFRTEKFIFSLFLTKKTSVMFDLMHGFSQTIEIYKKEITFEVMQQQNYGCAKQRST